MKLDVLDYSGHPCQVQLSRTLAARGHDVRHLYCPDYTSGKGATEKRVNDPRTFSVFPVPLGAEFDRYNVAARIRQELRFGWTAGQVIKKRAPDAAIVCNVPLLGHSVLVRLLNRSNIPMVFWQQDVYSHAIVTTATHRLGALGGSIGFVADRLERTVARRSSQVVAISSSFEPTLRRWKIPAGHYEIIPNWAALDEIPSLPKKNEWSKCHDFDGRKVFLYSGTLGLKHDPSVLLEIAREMAAEDPEARLVVVSQGAGRDWLAEHGAQLEQLVLLDYQPYADLPQVLGSADVLLAMLEPEAGVFSVPSKILNYLCAGRPTLAMMPGENAAAQTLRDVGAGIVVEPGDLLGLRSSVRWMLKNPADLTDMGNRARRYAEQAFDVEAVTDKFERRVHLAMSSVFSGTPTGRSEHAQQ